MYKTLYVYNFEYISDNKINMHNRVLGRANVSSYMYSLDHKNLELWL